MERTIQRDEAEARAGAWIATRSWSLQAVCRQVLVAPHVQEYAIQLVMATQPEQQEAHELSRKYIRYGSSPRGAQALVECGRVLALMRGRYPSERRRCAARGAGRAAPPHHSEFRRPRRRADAGDHPAAII